MNFEFILPSKIVFGQGSIARIGEEAKRLGAHRAVVITSRGMPKRESLRQVTDSLQDASLSFEIFSGVDPEPPLKNVSDCIDVVRENRCDLVVGLGGGSVLDVAKKAAADSGVPKIMAPTTAGTGSEVTHESVFRVDGKKRAVVDKNLVPDVAVVDPDVTMTMPPWLAASSGMDALAHALECYESKRSNPLVRSLALEASELLKGNIKKAVEGSTEAKANMSLGSLVAGMAFGNSGTTLAHALSYPLSNRGIAHGQAVAVVLSHALEFNGADASLIREVREVAELAAPKWDNGWAIEDMAREVMGDERHLANNPRRAAYEDVLRIFGQVRDSLGAR